MKRRLFIGTPHAPWFPHKSGYDPSLRPQEYDVGSKIAHELRGLLNGFPIEVEIFDMAQQFNCGAQCLHQEGRAECEQYESGLKHYIGRSKHADLAVTFHIDRAHPNERGPFCITHKDPLAAVWALTFLDVLEVATGVRRNLRTLFGKIIEGCVDLGDPRMLKQYRKKGFVMDARRPGVIVELGNVNNEEDAALLTSPGYVAKVAQAAEHATKHFFREAVEQWIRSC